MFIFSTLCTSHNQGNQQVDKVPHGLILNFCKSVVNKGLANEQQILGMTSYLLSQYTRIHVWKFIA